MENTFDLKKFLVENKLTNNSRLLENEGAALTPQQAAVAATKAVDSFKNDPAIEAVATKIRKNPKALEQLRDVLTKAGVNPNSLSESINNDVIGKLALVMAKKSENLEEDSDVGGGFWVGLIGGGFLANYLAGLNDIAYSAQEIIMGADNPSHLAATIGGAVLGAILGVVASAVFSS